MSSTPQRQGLFKKQSSSNGVIKSGTMRKRLYAASAFVLLAAFFALAVSPTQSVLATSSATSQQAGFVASTITDVLSFFGFGAEDATQTGVSPNPEPTPPIFDEQGDVKVYPKEGDSAPLMAPEAVGTFSGDTTGDPLFNRPLEGSPSTILSSFATAVPYEARQFTVDVTGLYTICLLYTSPSPRD